MCDKSEPPLPGPQNSVGSNQVLDCNKFIYLFICLFICSLFYDAYYVTRTIVR
jgi:hypothetical protein